MVSFPRSIRPSTAHRAGLARARVLSSRLGRRTTLTPFSVRIVASRSRHASATDRRSPAWALTTVNGASATSGSAGSGARPETRRTPRMHPRPINRTFTVLPPLRPSCLDFFEARGEVPKRRGTFDDAQAANLVALLEQLDDRLDDVVHVRLRVDAARHREPD